MFSQSELTIKEFEKVKGCKTDLLKNIANSKMQMEFLRVLSNSQLFIEWLKKETNGDLTVHSYLIIRT